MNGGAKKEVVGEEKEDDVDEALGTINDPDTPTAHGNVAEEDGDKAKYLKISKEPEEEKVELDNPLRDDEDLAERYNSTYEEDEMYENLKPHKD